MIGVENQPLHIVFNPVVVWVVETDFSCALGAVYNLVMVRWNRCSLNTVYCLSFNGYLHGVLHPHFFLMERAGGSLYLQTPTTPVLKWTISARSSHVLHPRRALVVEGGWLGFPVVIRWWVVIALGGRHGVVWFC